MATLPLNVKSSDPKISAVLGTHTAPDGVALFGVSPSNGVHGKSTGDGKGSSGVFGEAIDGPGVSGHSNISVGVDAKSDSGPAALRAVYGGIGGPGVLGVSPSNGVHGKSTGDGKGSSGVFGEAIDGPGVSGHSNSADGVFGVSVAGVGVHGKGGQLAGFFEGNVEVDGQVKVKGDIEVTGDIRFTNADCAEDFDVADPTSADPGTVMVLSEVGELRVSHQAYDKRVAGVISGAGDYKPGIILDKRHASANRRPIALLGKVYVKVDAQFGAVEVGDMLTSSPTPGHAMKTTDPLKAFGAVIGKALHPLRQGQALIPILIALQ
jgi:hypothetical protein